MKKPDKNQRLYYKVEGMSMYPALKNGDMVCVKQVNLFNINVGDIIIHSTLLSKEIIHRVIKKITQDGKQILITKGDNNISLGERVYPKDVLYKVLFVEKGGRRIELNKGLMKLRAIFYTHTSAIEMCIYSFFMNCRYILRHIILGKILQELQRLGIYKSLIMIYVNKNRIHYRAAKTNDAISLARLYRNYYWLSKLKNLAEVLNKSIRDIEECGCYFLAQIGNNVVGSVVIRRFSEEGHVLSGWCMYNFHVDWRYRNIIGIEQRLVKLAAERAEKEEAKEIKILVPRRNIFWVNFFQNLCGNPIPSQFDKQIVIFTYNVKLI